LGQAVSGQDSLNLQVNWKALQESLGENFDIQTLRFGVEVSESGDLDFSENATDLAGPIKAVADRYFNQNLGAVILLSDGIYNQGSNPIYALEGLNAPLYPIAIGDTNPKRDLKISKVYHNEIAYLDDKFEVRVDLQATELSGQSPQLSLQRISPGGGEAFLGFSGEDALQIPENFWLGEASFVLNADQPGFHHYRINASINGDDGNLEALYANNSWDFYVEVLDSRKKILILAHAPHPDLAALKQSIVTNKNYEAEIAFANDFAGDFGDYSLIILHGLPQAGQQALMDQVNAADASKWYILSSATDLTTFNTTQVMLKINRQRDQTDQVTGLVQEDFQLFALPENIRLDVADLPPITVPFGEYQLASKAKVMVKQQVGTVETDLPLFAFFDEFGKKQAVVTGEGLWRWRLYDYLEHGSHDAFDNLITKSVQYLSIEVDKRRFRVDAVKNIFSDNEEVALEAQLYNANYEPVNEPEVNVTISHEDGVEYPFVFSRSGNMYSLNAGYLPPGNYSFSAEVSYDGQLLTDDGAFSVKPLNLELVQTTADFNLLRLLANRFGGQVFTQNEMATLAEKIKNADTIAPQIYQTEKTLGAIHLKWIFFLILILLSAEWFVRKYLGSY
jgi:hypothetical protein